MLQLSSANLDKNTLRHGSLLRELVRQAVLIAARDELGLSTRDEALLESFPANDAPPVRPLDVVVHIPPTGEVAVTIFIHGKPHNILWQETWSLPEGELYEKLAEKAEGVSRGAFVEVLKRSGRTGTSKPQKPSGAVPAEVGQLLPVMDVVSQFSAVRRLHAAMRSEGESPEILAGLVRGYAQLGSLVEVQWGPAHKVFKARSLLYAERLVYRTKGSADALRQRGLARAFAGRHTAALEDFRAAEAAGPRPDPSDPSELARAWCLGDEQVLAAVPEGNPYAALARFLRLTLWEGTANRAKWQELASALFKAQPGCLRAIDSMADIGWLGIKGTTARAGEIALKHAVLPRMAHVPDIAAPLAEQFSQSPADGDGQESPPSRLARLLKELKAAGAIDRDRGEPSLEALGQLLHGASLLNAWRRLEYEQDWLAVPSDQTVSELSPLFEDHEAGTLLRSYVSDSKESARFKAEFANGINRDGHDRMEIRYSYAVANANSGNPGMISAALGTALKHVDDCRWDLIVATAAWSNRPDDAAEFAARLKAVAPQTPFAMEAVIRYPGEHKPSVSELAELEKQMSDNPALLTVLADAYRRIGEFEEEQRCAKRLTEIEPNTQSWKRLASAYSAVGDSARWVDALEKSLEFPVTGLEHGQSRNQIARHFMGRREWKAAEPYAKAAAQTGAAWAMLTAAEVAEELEDYETAESYCQSVAQRYENSMLQWFEFCVRTGHGDLEGAREFALASYLRNPRDTDEFLAFNARLRQFSERPDTAYDAMQKAFSRNRDVYYGLHAFLYADEAGKTKEAREVLEACAAILDTRTLFFHSREDYLQLIKLLLEDLKKPSPGKLDREAVDAILGRTKDQTLSTCSHVVGRYVLTHKERDTAVRYLSVAAAQPGRVWDASISRHLLRTLKADVPPRRSPYVFLSESAAADAPETGRLGGHTAPIILVRYTADSKLMVTCDDAGRICVRNLNDLKLLRTIEAEGSSLKMVIAPDSRTAAVSTTRSSEIGLWDLTNGESLGRIEPHFERVSSMGFSSDSQTLVAHYWHDADSRIGDLILWDVKDRTRKAERRLRTRPVSAVSFRPEGQILLGGSADGSNFRRMLLSEWKPGDENPRTLFESPSGTLIGAAISPVGRIACLTHWNLLLVYDLKEKKVVAQSRIAQVPSGMTISPDGQLVGFVTRGGTIDLWDVAGDRWLRIPDSPASRYSAVAFSVDSRRLFCGTDAGTIEIREIDGSMNGDPRKSVVVEFPVNALANSLGMAMVPVPAGEFIMGDPPEYKPTPGYGNAGEKLTRPAHRVRLSRGFYLGQTEVTVGQFRKFVEETGYTTSAEKTHKVIDIVPPVPRLVTRADRTWKNPGYPQEDDHPVVVLSWLDAQEFCQWLSKREGVTYRLPAEAEWEYACRGGSHLGYSVGTPGYIPVTAINAADRGLRKIFDSYPVASPISDGWTFSAPVRYYPPNPFGLYEMHGNASEYCQDWFGEKWYEQSPGENPTGPDHGERRVVRGGDFFSHADNSRSAFREGNRPDEANTVSGFRVVREF